MGRSVTKCFKTKKPETWQVLLFIGVVAYWVYVDQQKQNEKSKGY